MENIIGLHTRPSSYNGANNRKMTLARMKQSKVQSIPVYEKDKKGRIIGFLGYNYIYH